MMQDKPGPHLRQVLARWQQYRSAIELTRPEAEDAAQRRINADTTMMEGKEVKRLGLWRRKHKPGVTLHQMTKATHGELKVLYPLLAMVVLAFGLAGITAYRELVLDPSVQVDKRRRLQSTDEIEKPEEVRTMSRAKADSPFRRLSRPNPLAHIQEEPPILPGDDKATLGQPGSKEKHGQPLGGGY